MNKLSKILLFLAAALTLIFALALTLALVFERGDSFHQAGSMRFAVWAAKRIVAETAGLAVALRDPYRGSLIKAGLGPANPGPRSSAGNFAADSAGLQRRLENSAAYQGALVRCFSSDSLPRSAFPFYYQTWAEPKLDSLARLYRLAEVFGEYSEDYAGFLKLNRWLHEALSKGEPRIAQFPEVDYNFNALDIFYRAGRGERFWCSEYSTTLVQCLAALGYTARYLMLNADIGGHVLCEAWSDSYGKWVMLDPFYGRVVTLAGVPLNVYEIHTLLADRVSCAKAVVVQSGQALAPGGERDFYFSLFRQFAVRMRNDWFTNRYPHWYPLSNSVLNALEWQDSLTSDNIKYKYETGRLADLYWPLNRVRLTTGLANSAEIGIQLETFTPNFVHFFVAFGDSVFSEIGAGSFGWKLAPGANRLSVAAVNHWGIQGKPAVLEIDWPGPRVN